MPVDQGSSVLVQQISTTNTWQQVLLVPYAHHIPKVVGLACIRHIAILQAAVQTAEPIISCTLQSCMIVPCQRLSFFLAAFASYLALRFQTAAVYLQ